MTNNNAWFLAEDFEIWDVMRFENFFAKKAWKQSLFHTEISLVSNWIFFLTKLN